MADKICDKCKEHMKLIPEGVAKKSGKQFSAFWGCTKECGNTASITEQQGKFMSMKHEFKRSREIAYFNSTNSAIELVKLDTRDINQELLGKMIIVWRKWFLKEWEEWYIQEILGLTKEEYNKYSKE